MAYQGYSAYHPSPQSHSEALRPTVNTSFGHNTAYEPVRDTVSPGASPINSRPQFAQQDSSYSTDSVNGGRYYGAGGGGSGEGMARQYSDDIPLQHTQPANYHYDPAKDNSSTSKLPQAFVGEAANGAEEVAREQSQRHRSRRQKKPVGFFHKVAVVCWFMTGVQVAVFIGELVKFSILTGSPIQTKPNFNPMIGPSPYFTISMGARFAPCMKDPSNLNLTVASSQGQAGSAITANSRWLAPNATTGQLDDPSQFVSLGELCGMGAQKGDYPLAQWWRFITPIFLHAGIIHIGFNMLLQMTLGREIERLIGSVRFLVVYMAAGIFGNVLGANYAAAGLPSTGASGALFGITAISLLDLLYTWQRRKRPGVELAFIFVEIVVTFVLGLLPAIDNFAHIGGLLTGLVLGMCLLRSPDQLRKRIRTKAKDSPTSPIDPSDRAQVASVKGFTKKPLGFFQGRKPLWWAWWLVRAGCLAIVFITFIVLLNNFYKYSNTCTWCRYLSCLPVNGWCDLGSVAAAFDNTTSPAPHARSLFLTGADLTGFA